MEMFPEIISKYSNLQVDNQIIHTEYDLLDHIQCNTIDYM